MSEGTRQATRRGTNLEILAHSNLLHELVLVSVHCGRTKEISKCTNETKSTGEGVELTSGELPDVSEHVLETIGELEGVDVPKPELNVDVDDELGETKDLSAKMD